MAEFTLPKNSKIEPGKTISAANGATRKKKFSIYRWEPDSGKNPRLDTYEVNLDNFGPMVLDAMIYIKNDTVSWFTLAINFLNNSNPSNLYITRGSFCSYTAL